MLSRRVNSHHHLKHFVVVDVHVLTIVMFHLQILEYPHLHHALSTCLLLPYYVECERCFDRLVGVWNLPSQREAAKKKVRRVADSFAKQIEEAMKDDLQKSIDAVRAEFQTLAAPYRNAAEEKLRRVKILQEELLKLDTELKRLRQSVQSIGT